MKSNQELFSSGQSERFGENTASADANLDGLPAKEPPGELQATTPETPELSDINAFIEKVKKRLAEKQKLDVQRVAEEDISSIVQEVRETMATQNIRFEIALDNNGTVMNIVRIKELAETTSLKMDLIKDRKDAIGCIDDKYRTLSESWGKDNNHFRLDDEVMERHFERKDHEKSVDKLGKCFLTTYFDSAQFGLENKLLDAQAKLDSQKKGRFDKNVENRLSTFIELFTSSHANRFNLVGPEGIPINVAFQSSGTEAFKLFFRNFVKDDEKMLITAEEYIRMFKKIVPKEEYERILKGEGERIITLPECKDLASYERAIKDALKDSSIKHMLASTLTRSGALLPTNRFYELCESSGVNFIADACQSAGDMPHDILAHIIIGSMQKGSELGGSSVGFMMLANEFIQRNNPEKVANITSVYDGRTLDPIILARALIAANPSLKRMLIEKDNPEDRPPDKMKQPGSHERQQTTKDLGYRFVQLVQCINKEHGDRIEFSNDHLINSGDKIDKVTGKRINRDEISPIFECRIKGVPFSTVQKVAQDHGVVINNYSDAWDKGNSFRIRFKSFMGNKSVKILGRVLEKCCEL